MRQYAVNEISNDTLRKLTQQFELKTIVLTDEVLQVYLNVILDEMDLREDRRNILHQKAMKQNRLRKLL